MRDAYAPLVWQCRYSGIEVPDDLWHYVEFGRDKKYGDNQAEHMEAEPQVYLEFDQWVSNFVTHVGEKGKVPPGKHRAYGYRPPSHVMADLKTKWLGLRMALGFPPPESSVAVQQKAGLNRDVGVFFKKGEGEKLRD